MNKAVRILVYLLIVAAILAASAAAFRHMAARSRKGDGKSGAGLEAVPIRVAPVSRATLRQVLTLSGDVEPLLQVDLRPKIAARLERLALEDGAPVEEGTIVQAGAILARLDKRDLEAQAAQARAAVETAQAAMRAAQAALDDAQRERRRAENLFAQGSITEQARDRAVTAHDQAAAALAQSGAQAAQAKAALQAAEVLLDEAVLRAPFDGVVAATYADPGSMVSPAAPLLRIVSQGELRILVAVPAVHLAALAPGKAAAEARFDAWPGRAFPCVIRAVYPEVDAATRTATVELRVANPAPEGDQALLRPGMYAAVRIVLDTRENVIAAPLDAIIRIGERQLVFLAEGNTARARDIVTGLLDGPLAEIRSGLAEGEPLVVQGQHRLTDGAAVTRVGEAEAGGEARP